MILREVSLNSQPIKIQTKAKGFGAFGKLMASLVIVGTISAQAYMALLRMACNSKDIPVFCDVPTDPSLYPFLDYPMYSEAHKEGATVPNYTLVAIFEDGSEKTLTPEDFGLSPYWFNTGLLPAFQAKNALEVSSYLADYTAAGNSPFIAFRFENNLFTITKEGVLTEDSDVFTSPLPLVTED